LEKNGFNRICGADYNKIINSFDEIIEAEFDYSIDLYGKGNTSQAIVDKLLEMN
jgi:UDP-N-acetylglucosamine 2-epimerase